MLFGFILMVIINIFMVDFNIFSFYWCLFLVGFVDCNYVVVFGYIIIIKFLLWLLLLFFMVMYLCECDLVFGIDG